MLSSQNYPLYNATVKVLETEEVFEVSKNAAHFKAILSAGQYHIQVACHGYQTKTVPVVVSELVLSELRVVLGVNQSINDKKPAGETVVITDGSMHEPFVGSTTSGIKGEETNTYNLHTNHINAKTHVKVMDIFRIHSR